MFAIHMRFAGIMLMTALIAVILSKPTSHELGAIKHTPAYYTAPTMTHSVSVQPSAVASTVRRQSDGLFYVEGQANGQSVQFVVDTGATMVVLNRADAAKLGIAFDELASSGRIRTVQGVAEARWVTIKKLQVLDKQLENVRAAVVDGPLPVSLMGHSALSKLGAVTMQGNILKFH